MRKKIICTIAIATLTTTAFLVGHVTETTATDKTMIAVEDITDWNTDGKELALSLSDGTEVYAYKSEDVYKPDRIQYIATGDIVDVESTETGFTIVCADGNGYYFER